MYAGAPLDADQLARQLNVQRIGRLLCVLPQATSTNKLCLEAAELESDGLAMFAEYQTAGRGRLGRSWWAPRGSSLLFSVLLIEPPDVVRPARWLLQAGLAVAEAIRAETDVEALLRWPNDLMAVRAGTTRKLGGILIETRRLSAAGKQAWVIGVGLNCLQHAGHFPPEFRQRATSLEMESAGPIDRLSLARRLLQGLDREWSRRPDDALLRQRWLKLALPLLGERVCLQADSRRWTGTVVDLDPGEGLVLQLADGARRSFGLQASWLEGDEASDASETG